MKDLEKFQLFVNDLVSAIKLPALKIENNQERDKFIGSKKELIKNSINKYMEKW